MPTIYVNTDRMLTKSALQVGAGRTLLDYMDELDLTYVGVIDGTEGGWLYEGGYQLTRSPGGMLGGACIFRRWLLEFDVSDIQRPPAAAEFKFQVLSGYAHNTHTANMICVDAQFKEDGTITKEDWHSYNFTEPLAITETLPSSSLVPAGSPSTVNFNDAGLGAIGRRDKLQMVCVEKDHDYARNEPSSAVGRITRTMQDTDDLADGDFKPRIEYTPAPPPYEVNGGILKINGGIHKIN